MLKVEPRSLIMNKFYQRLHLRYSMRMKLNNFLGFLASKRILGTALSNRTSLGWLSPRPPLTCKVQH